MCTLTYYPLKRGRIITANRDESPARKSEGLSTFNTGADNWRIAKEPVHGGTNFAATNSGAVYTLLNGAFERHDTSKKYGRSRGLVLLDALEHQQLDRFRNWLELNAEVYGLGLIEPFTIVKLDNEVEELRWTGSRITTAKLSANVPHLWASAQLYDPEVLQKRQRWFDELLERKNELSAYDLWDFHTTAGEGDPANDLMMNRNNLVRTVSITQVLSTHLHAAILHRDILSGLHYRY